MVWLICLVRGMVSGETASEKCSVVEWSNMSLNAW